MDDRERMELFERQAEEAYSRMYDAMSASDAAARYSDAKEALYSAIGIARALGADESVKRFEARLAHVKAIFRSQFS
jgi:hypothetical protein